MLKDSGLKIVVTASGSRGDVQPYIALALALKSRGHNVSVASEERMMSLVQEFGLEFRKIGGDPTGLLFEPNAQEVLKKGKIMALIKLTTEWDARFDKREILNSYITACAGADMIIASALTMTQTYCVAEKMGCSWLPMILGPTLVTSEFPLWVMSRLICCFSCLNKWTYTFAFTMLWKTEAKFINPWRVEVLHLSPIGERRGILDIMELLCPPILIACSEMICGPFGRIPADYPNNAYMNGFLFVPPTDEIDVNSELVRFVKTDPLATNGSSRPVIYLGFGSMPAPHPEDLIRVAIQVCHLSHCRAVLVAGWSEIQTGACFSLLEDSRLTSTVMVVKAAPHDWLFPKMSCIVHHCGV